MRSDVSSDECSAEYYTVNITVDEVIDLYTPTDTIMITIVLPIILCLGVIFNSTFLFVVYRVPKVRSDTTIYLLHLALADCIYLTHQVYSTISSYLSSPVRWNSSFTHSAQCVVHTLVAIVGYFTPMALITMMSFERYLALCHPLKHLKIRGRRRTLKIVTCCWLVGIVYAILLAPYSCVLHMYCLQWFDNDSSPELTTVLITYCSPVYPWVVYFTDPLTTVPYLTVMIGNIYMYTRIIVMLHKRRSAGGMLDKDKRALRIRNQVAKMLIVNGVIFFICQTPFAVVLYGRWLCTILGNPTTLGVLFALDERWLILLPTLFNTIVNPVVYGVMNAQYWAAFNQAVLCKALPNGRPRGQNLQAVNATISSATQDNNNADQNTTIESRGTRL